MPEERQAIHAHVSDKAKLGWERLADESGCSATSLLEWLGCELHDELEEYGILPERMPMIEGARKIVALRRKRRRD